jgi:hypothetical protein
VHVCVWSVCVSCTYTSVGVCWVLICDSPLPLVVTTFWKTILLPLPLPLSSMGKAPAQCPQEAPAVGKGTCFLLVTHHLYTSDGREGLVEGEAPNFILQSTFCSSHCSHKLFSRESTRCLSMANPCCERASHSTSALRLSLEWF